MSAPASGAPGSPTLASVLRCALPAYTQSHRLPEHHWKVLRAIQACRTPELGGHLYGCPHCHRDHFVPHSCRNRHCPTCQGANSVDWLEKQAQALLPIPYFHLVFTLPHELNALIQHNQAALYDLLFAAASATLVEFGHRRLQARIGVTAVLHTWSQTLLDHYHLHCIVTGGGLSTDTEGWRAANPRWLFPVRALSGLFRAKFRDGLEALYERGELRFGGCVESLASPAKFRRLVRQACRQKWVVYAKRPFAGPEAVLGYLSRYTHRVGITNRRLLSLDAGTRTVRFAYKDYADDARRKVMSLGLEEFVRRFCLHILPPRFVKIRHYGILSTRNRSHCVEQARTALGAQAGSNAMAAAPPAKPSAPAEPPASTLQCPHCLKPGLILIRVVRPPQHPRPPPDDTS
jgi:hypothetical protein